MRFGITRTRLIIALVLVLIGLLAVWLLYSSYTWPGNIRNVLLISIDTCRADHLSCYGYKSKTTPNIDALAAEGILFENVISPVPITLPAHSAMLTGTIPPYHGVHANVGGYLADESNITLAEILKDAGFATTAVISAFVLDSQFGIDQGFDSYYDRFEGSLEAEAIEQRQAEQTTGLAIDWLEQNKDRRFFFFLHYYDPHTPYEPPEPFAARFAADPYVAEIAYTDHYIGKVLAKLKELDLYDSTLIIVTADHGEMRGEHGELTHRYFIYQGAVKVPLIFKVPGQNKAVRIESMAGLIDIVPTVCGLLNIKTPKNIQGLDLFGASKGKNTSGQGRHIYCESLTPTNYKANSLLGMLNDRYKYIQTTRPELYDLISDPGESNNLFEKQPQRARIMQDKLAQMLQQSVRKGSPHGKVVVDSETIARLGALGYVGGVVTEDFSFDQTKDDPKDLLKYYSLAEQIVASFESKEYDKMEMYAKEMIRQRPDLLIPYEKMGLIALEQEDYSKAIVYFQKIIEIDPDHGWADQKRGYAYLRKGDYDQAIDVFNQIIRELNQGLEQNQHAAVEAYGTRGMAYLGKGNYDRAVDDFNQVVKLDPKQATHYNNRGFAYLQKGEYDHAIRDFNKAIELDSRYAKAYANRGTAYSNRGQNEGAIRDYRQAIELSPNNADTYKKMILALIQQNRAKEAVSYYHQAVGLLDDQPLVLNNVAWLLATHQDPQLRDGAEALRLAVKACELTNYKVPSLLDTLAAAYAETGQFANAVKTVKKAIKLAQGAGQKELAQDIQPRLELYKAKRPYRQ